MWSTIILGRMEWDEQPALNLSAASDPQASGKAPSLATPDWRMKVISTVLSLDLMFSRVDKSHQARQTGLAATT
jgi:hypothetical protein